MQKYRLGPLSIAYRVNTGNNSVDETIERILMNSISLTIAAASSPEKLVQFNSAMQEIARELIIDLAKEFKEAKQEAKRSNPQRHTRSTCPDWSAGMRTPSGKCPNCLEVHK